MRRLICCVMHCFEHFLSLSIPNHKVCFSNNSVGDNSAGCPNFSGAYVISLMSLIGDQLILIGNEPPHGKTNHHPGRKERCSQLPRNREADQRLCFRYSDSTILLLLKSEIPSFLLFSVLVQVGLCRTWSETTLFVFPRGGSNIR